MMRALGISFIAFVVIAVATEMYWAERLDRAARGAIYLSEVPKWIREAVRDVTSLGSFTVLGTITLIAVLTLLNLGHRREVALLATVALGGLLVSNLLKIAFDRQRPELSDHLTVVYTSSFPSSHAMMSTAIFLTLARIGFRQAATSHARITFLIFGTTIPVAVGLSRVSLGVHWLTDVMAGWAAGVFWAMLVERCFASGLRWRRSEFQ